MRLMINPNFDFGFNPATRSNYPELSDYDELVVECAEKLRQTWSKGSYWNTVTNNISGCRDVKNLIIYHPLWSKIRLIAMGKSDNVPLKDDKGNTTLAIFNTFRVLRSDLEPDKLPNNADMIPAMALNDQGQSVDPKTGLVLGISL